MPGATATLQQYYANADTGHVALGYRWDRFIEVAGDRLMHVRANDNRGRFDEHLPPGDGTIDWAHIRATLARIDFDGWIVLELACPAGSIADFIGNAMQRAHALFT